MNNIANLNIWRLLGWMMAVAVITVLPINGWAADNPFSTLCSRINETYTNGRQIVYVIAGIATLSLGVLAFFGRFRWTTFFAMVGGIFVIAIFDQILGFASNGAVTSANCS